MNKQRLLKLANHLETAVKDEEFDFSTYWCGTVGCALGHATRIPEFREAGFHLEPYSHREGSEPVFHRYGDGMNAARAFFDLYYLKDAFYLFLPGDSGLGPSATPKQVAAHIREFVKDHPPEWFVAHDDGTFTCGGSCTPSNIDPGDVNVEVWQYGRGDWLEPIACRVCGCILGDNSGDRNESASE